jgi:ketosteroid isomerase-like protein
VKRFFQALDALDADAVAAFFTDHAIVRLPGAAPVEGRSAIRKTIIQLSLALDEIHHDTVSLWVSGDLSVYEADVKLNPAGRSLIAFPATYIIRWRKSLIEQVRVSIYLESRLSLAISSFDRLCRINCGLAKPA